MSNVVLCDYRKEEIDRVIMDVISQGPSKATSRAAATSMSSKPKTAVRTTNGRNVKPAINDDTSEDDVNEEEEMHSDEESSSDDYQVVVYLVIISIRQYCDIDCGCDHLTISYCPDVARYRTRIIAHTRRHNLTNKVHQ